VPVPVIERKLPLTFTRQSRFSVAASFALFLIRYSSKNGGQYYRETQIPQTKKVQKKYKKMQTFLRPFQPINALFKKPTTTCYLHGNARIQKFRSSYILHANVHTLYVEMLSSDSIYIANEMRSILNFYAVHSTIHST
jgi:hypothetical protein